MDWFILLLCVPSVVVPVVLLFGFAGCGLDTTGQLVLPTVPANLHATLAANRKGIDLVWLPTGGAADGFVIARTAAGEMSLSLSSTQPSLNDSSPTLKPGVTYHYTVRAIKSGQPAQFSPTGPSNDAFATMPPTAPVLSGQLLSANVIRLNWTASPHATRYRLKHLTDNTVVYEGDQTTADHSGVQTGTHDYQVAAIVGVDKNNIPQGFNDSQPADVFTDSATLQVIAGTVTPPNWVPIFSAAGIAPNPNNGVEVANDCVVQRIPAPASPGTQVRVTLRGITNQNPPTVLAAVTISKAVLAGGAQPQNSVDTPVPITFGGMAGVTLPTNGTAQLSDPVNYPVVAGQDLHVAFNVAAASGRVLRRNVAGAVAYRKNNAIEAGLATRPPPYNENNNVVFCIETIEVA
jgi:hypothetical protein